MKRIVFSLISICLLSASPMLPQAMADSISPSINDNGKVYSTEPRNSAYFGTGTTGRLSEASYLRFIGDQQMSDGNVDGALKSLAKAVQLDSTDPEGHIMLARAMTRKIRMKSNQTFNWELYGQCLDEWTLIAKHDADHNEQLEAKNNMSSLKKLAKEELRRAKGGKVKEKRSLLAGLKPFNRLK